MLTRSAGVTRTEDAGGLNVQAEVHNLQYCKKYGNSRETKRRNPHSIFTLLDYLVILHKKRKLNKTQGKVGDNFSRVCCMIIQSARTSNA